MNEERMENLISEKKLVYRTYKDRVFRMLFSNRKRLLELYNALNDTDYTDEEELTINTLENAIFMKMKNDVSFVIDSDICLFEHQSSYCPNMALRGFLYFADLYKKQIRNAELSGTRKIWIPTPRYIVFYNGLEKKTEEFTQSLSESFENHREGCMELTVRIININYGQNRKLMEKCRTLSDYAYFVAEIRKNLETMELDQAVERAVDTCIEKDILREFLREQKAEVIAMSIYEYNEEYVKKTLLEDGYDKGKEDGFLEGEARGKTEGRAVTLVRSIEAAMKNFHVNLEEACAGLDITVEEYEKAKKGTAGSSFQCVNRRLVETQEEDGRV